MAYKLAVLAAALFALASCALPTLYQPAGGNGYGYAQQQLEANRFRVSFTGNDLTAREAVENYLFYRAAEITLANGGDYFVITHRDTEARTRYDSGFDTAYGYGPWGPWNRHSAFVGVSSATPITQYRAYADIVIYAGRKPAGDANAYDARDVMARLAPTVIRPAPPKGF